MSNSKGDKVKCGTCGFKQRGSNHEDGSHHQAAVKALEARGLMPDKISPTRVKP